MVKLNNIFYYNNYDIIQKQNSSSVFECVNFFNGVRISCKDVNKSEKSINAEIKNFFLLYLLTESFPRIQGYLYMSKNSLLNNKEESQKNNQNFILDYELHGSKNVKDLLNILYIELLNTNSLKNVFLSINEGMLTITIPVKSLINIEEISKLFKTEIINYFFIFEFRSNCKKINEKKVNITFPFWGIMFQAKKSKRFFTIK